MDERDVILGVHYRLQCPKPCNFHGFEARMVFQTATIGIVKKNDAKVIIAEGSVSEGSDISNYDPSTGELRVEVLSSTMFDTSNHLLFKYRANIKVAPGDSALVIPTRFDPINGFDTVIIENSTGKDDISWFAFPIAFGDTAITIPPKKRDIVLSSDALTIKSDSTAITALSLSGVDSAKIQTGTFACIVDTAIVGIDGIVAITPSMAIANTSNGDTLRIKFASAPGFIYSGKFCSVMLHAKHRVDSVCTVFKQPDFLVTNVDNLVATVTYKLDSICVYGRQADTTHSDVDFWSRPDEISIVSEARRLRIHTIESANDLRIFSVTGALVYSAVLTANDNVIEPTLPSGVYIIVLKGQRALYRKPVVIVH